MRLFMRMLKIVLTTVMMFVAFGNARAADAAPPLTADHTHFLMAYESVRAALASDDLAASKSAALALPRSESATLLTKADSLNMARVAFKKLSAEAESLVRGRKGYFLMHCPMVDADWVQSSRTVSNPYLGKKMATCGHVIEQ